ncbi:MAG: hypothetical protein RLY31_71 [Bacteroidota bacterium]|jgi:chorismate dehydratase
MKYHVTAVSYLNTKPFLYGLLNSPVAADIELTLDHPADCARKLKDGTADLGLVPVAIIPELSSPELVSDYCIGAEGKVRTVCLFSEVPLSALENIYLDYQSRTSVALLRILLKEFWHQQPVLIPASPGFESEIRGTTGGLVIGDRAIGLESHYPYVYDLGEAWLALTGLPFVFAAWVANRELPTRFRTAFDHALRHGIEQIPQLMYLLPSPSPSFDLQGYFTRNIRYVLDMPKRSGLSRFLRNLHPRTPGADRFLDTLAQQPTLASPA